MDFDGLILTIIKSKVNSQDKLEGLKREFAKTKAISLPKNYQLLRTYRKLLGQKKIRRQLWLEKLLVVKPVRTLSGVTPLAVLVKAFPCPGECLYCPDQGGVPKSYLADEPAVLRAQQFDFDPQKQVEYRLKVFKLMGHRVSKIELIILGGTFSYYPRKYRQEFIKACFEACNQKKSLSLLRAQKINQTAGRRIIGITVETRPDLVDQEEIKFLRKLGVTRVELGVQSLYPSILKVIRRGHGIKEVVEASRLLKNAGFKICYHLMPGLPGSTSRKDVAMFKKIFTDSRFRPDFLKIYPCVVLKNTPLYQDWLRGKFKPLRDEELVKLLVKIKKVIPSYLRINRLGRDIPVGNIVAGYRYSHIRQLVQKELEKQQITCQCIRCREIRKSRSIIENCKLKIVNYVASGGREYFLQFVDKNSRLYALLRLRLPPKNSKPIFPALKNAALVRELHTYGQSLAIGEKKLATQHRGLGRRLLKKAEEIARKKGFSKMAVISGVGAREYYQNLDYRLKQSYMIKNLLFLL